MKATVDVSDLLRESAVLFGVADKYPSAMRRTLAATGNEAVHYIQRRFRTGGSIRSVGRDGKGRRLPARKLTTETRTRIITGALLKAYGSSVSSTNESHALDVGLIAPGATGNVLHYGRTQEGYPANSDTPVDKFVIRPKRPGGLLRFRIDGQWVSAREVTLRPRPSFPTIQDKLPPVLQTRVLDEMVMLLGGKPSGAQLT